MQAKRDLVSLSSLERKQYNHYLYVTGQLASSAASASSSSAHSSRHAAPASAPASALLVAPIEPARRAYCVCRRPHEKSAAMVQCHCCAEWYGATALLCVSAVFIESCLVSSAAIAPHSCLLACYVAQ